MLSLLADTPEEEMRTVGCDTYEVDGCAAVGEPAGRPLGEVDAVGVVVGTGEREDAVVVAVVDEGVAEDEEAGDLLRGHWAHCHCHQHKEGNVTDHC